MNNGNIVQAVYVEQEVVDYQGNPYIEALPPIMKEEEAFKALFSRTRPEFDERERDLDAHYRVHCVPRLCNFFLPLTQQLDFERDIGIVLRQGYKTRNPLGKEYVARARQGYKQIQSGQYTLDAKLVNPALGFAVIGISGVGKSRTVEETISLYPKVIEHKNYAGKHFITHQIPFLKLDCPHDGASLKGLCFEFFKEVDKLMDDKSNYYSKFANSKSGVEILLGQMQQIANNHGLGVLIIDEVQHLSLAGQGNADRVLNFFVTMVNKLSLPIIFVGNYQATDVLQKKFRQAKRGTGLGTRDWNRLIKERKDDWEDWKLMIENLWAYQWTKNPVALTNEITEVLYDETQGIVDLVVKLLMASQIRAITDGSEKITISLIKNVASDIFKLLKPALKALREGDSDIIAQYDDLLELDMLEYIERNLPKLNIHERAKLIKEAEKKQRELAGASIQEQAILKLLKFDSSISAPQAKRYTEKVIQVFIKEGHPLDLEKILRIALQQIWDDMKTHESSAPVKPQKTRTHRTRKIRGSEVLDIDGLEEKGLFDDPLIDIENELPELRETQG